MRTVHEVGEAGQIQSSETIVPRADALQVLEHNRGSQDLRREPEAPAADRVEPHRPR